MNRVLLSRRAWLVGVLGVTGCSISDPTIKGGPAAGATATPSEAPVRDPRWTPAVESVRALEQHAAACVGAAAALQAPPEFPARYASCRDAFAAQLVSLGHVDPLDATSDRAPEQQSVSPAPAPASVAAADEQFTALLTTADKRFDEAFAAFVAESVPDAQPLALTALSLRLAAATAGLPSGRFEPSEVVPIRFPATTPGASRGVLLSQVWAAIYAYEVGLGIASMREPVIREGLTRLSELKQLRDEVTAAITPDNRPEQLSSYDLGGKPDSLASIVRIWALAETRLMDAFARLAATSPREGDATAAAIAQVGRVVALGGALPHWPGWV